MNCHKDLKGLDTYAQKNISNTYDAAGFNADSMKYTRDSKPITWNKVYNLPDHVYFPHAAHINAGLECKSCHGETGTDTLNVLQANGLKNDYYNEIHQRLLNNDSLLKKYLNGNGQNMKTISEIGSLNCAKCHY